MYKPLIVLTGSWTHLNSKVPTEVDGRRGVNKKWFLGDKTVTSYFCLSTSPARRNPPQPAPTTTRWDLCRIWWIAKAWIDKCFEKSLHSIISHFLPSDSCLFTSKWVNPPHSEIKVPWNILYILDLLYQNELKILKMR